MAGPTDNSTQILFGQPVIKNGTTYVPNITPNMPKPMPTTSKPPTPGTPTTGQPTAPTLPTTGAEQPTEPVDPYQVAIDLTKQLRSLQDNNTNLNTSVGANTTVIADAVNKLGDLRSSRIGLTSQALGIASMSSGTPTGAVVPVIPIGPSGDEVLQQDVINIARTQLSLDASSACKNKIMFDLAQYTIIHSDQSLTDLINIMPEEMRSDPANVAYITNIHEKAKGMFAGIYAGYETPPVKPSNNVSTETVAAIVRSQDIQPKEYVALQVSQGITVDNLASILEVPPDKLLSEDTRTLMESVKLEYDNTHKMLDHLNSFEIPPLGLVNITMEALMQPTLLVGDLFQYIGDVYSKPFTGQGPTGIAIAAYQMQKGLPNDWSGAAQAFGRGASTSLPLTGPLVSKLFDPDVAAVGKQMMDKMATDGWWNTSRSIYDINAEAIWGPQPIQWATKLANEIILDPTSYIGMWKIAPAALSKIPTVLRWLPRINNAWITATDTAGLVSADIIRGLMPKTVAQKASEIALESAGMLQRVSIRAFGADRGSWDIEKIAEVLKNSIKIIEENPAISGTSEDLKLARSLLQKPNITSHELNKLLTDMGMGKLSAISEKDVSKLVKSNDVYEGMRMVEAGSGATEEDSAQKLLEILGAPRNDDTVAAATKFLTSRLNRDLNRVEASFSGTGVKTVDDLFNGVKRHVGTMNEANMESEVTKWKLLDGKATSFMKGFPAQIINALDSQVTIPLARQALWFTTFGPGNAVEAIVRSAFAGYNVIPDMFMRGNDVIRAFEWAAGDLKAFPISEISAAGHFPVMQSLDKTTGNLGKLNAAGKLVDRSKTAILDNLANNIFGVGKDTGLGDFIMKYKLWKPEWGNIPGIGSLKSWRETWDVICDRGKCSQYMQSYLGNVDAMDPAGALIRQQMRKDIMKAGFTGVNQRELQELSDVVVIAHINPARLAEISDLGLTHFRKTVISIRVNQLMGKYPWIQRDTIDTAINQIINKGGINDTDKVAAQLIHNMYGDEMGNILKSSDVYKEAAAEFGKLNLTDPYNSQLVMYMLHGLDEAHVNNINELHDLTQVVGSRMAKPGREDDFYKAAFDAHQKYLTDSNQALTDIIGNIKGKGDTMFPKNSIKQQSFNNAVNYYENRIKLFNDSKQAELDILSRHQANKAGLRDWAAINSERQAAWKATDKKAAQFKASWLLSSKHGPAYEIPQFKGDLLISHVAYMYQKTPEGLIQSLYRGENNTLLTKTEWVNHTVALADELAQNEGKIAATVGFDEAAVGNVYDDMMKRLNLDPMSAHSMSLNLRDAKDLKYGLRDIANGMNVSQHDTDTWNTLMAKFRGPGYESTVNSDIREQAMIEARKSVDATFPDYSKENAGDAIMRKIAPYWTYEANRPIWLIKTMVQKPGVLHATGTYFNNTNGGDIPIPGTDYVWNPLANSVWSTLRRGYQKGAPDYYNNLNDPVKVFFDKLGKMGFYPGAWYPLVSGILLHNRDDLQSVLPPYATNALALAEEAWPADPAIRSLQDVVFPSQWKWYLNATWMAKNGIDSKPIISKMVKGEALTTAEQDIWNRASADSSGYQFINTELGNVFKYQPEVLRNAREQHYELVQRLTGIPVDVQKWIYQHQDITGKDLSSYVQIDPVAQGLISASQDIVSTAGNSLALMPDGAQAIYFRMQDMAARKEYVRSKYYDKGSLNKMDIQREVMDWAKNGSSSKDGITFDKWVSSTRALQDMQADEYDTIDKDYASYPKYNPDTGEGIPRTLDERLDSYKKHGSNFLDSSLNMLIDKYNTIKLGTYTDPETNREEPNFKQYFADKGMIIDSLPPNIKPIFMAKVNASKTDMDLVYENVANKYLRPYQAVYDLLLQQYSPKEQDIIKSQPLYTVTESEASEAANRVEADTAKMTQLRNVIETTNDPDLKDISQQALTNLEGTHTKSLLADFRGKLTNIKTNLRIADPDLDAWLMVFGKVNKEAHIDLTQAEKNSMSPMAVQIRKELGWPDPNIRSYDGSLALKKYTEILKNIGDGNFKQYQVRY
jgi:hypothetical protein